MITLTLALTVMVHFTWAQLPFCCKDVESHPNLKLLAAPSECGVPADTPAPAVAGRIRGGETTVLGERPWMVLVAVSKQDEEFKCGGTLISRNHVLSVAHCLLDIESPDNVTIIVGENVLSTDIDCDWTGRCSPPPKQIKVALAIVHEHYDPLTVHNDIALLKLASDVEFSDFIKPICLPLDCELLKEDLTGKKVETAGWGYLDIELVRTSDSFEYVYKESKNLMKLTQTVRNSQKDCPTYYVETEGDIIVATAPSQICTSYTEDPTKSKSPCGGDSGSPLTYEAKVNGVTKHVQVGIVSLGSECKAGPVTEVTDGYSSEPYHFTRVSWFIFWILDHLSD